MFVNDFTMTRAGVIAMALRLIGVLPTGEDTSSDFIVNQTEEAQTAFQMILSFLQNKTSSPFKEKVLSVNPVASEEVTGSDSLIYTAIATHSSPNASTWALSTSYAKGALVFASPRGAYFYQAQNAGTSGGSQPSFPTQPHATVSDNTIVWRAYPDTKPVTGAIYKQYWKQSGSTGGAYAQNTEYRSIGEVRLDPYTMSVSRVWLRRSNAEDVQIRLVSRQEYMEIVDKTETGEPILAFFDDTFTPTLKLWPQPDTTSNLIFYNATVVYNDMDNGSDTGVSTENYLNRWMMYFVYTLAVHLGEEYQIKSTKLERLERKSKEYEALAIIRDSNVVNQRFICGAY